jgi:tetratricopeptide (TPR) repeat protein
MKRTNPDQALALLRRAIGAKNDVRIAYVDLGAVLTQQKHYEEAVTALRRAVELDPAQPDAHYRLGRAYQAMGNSAESQKEFARVRELTKKQTSLSLPECRRRHLRCRNRNWWLFAAAAPAT